MTNNFFNTSNHEMQLSCMTDDDGVIRLKMCGNLSSEYEKEFLEWSEAVKQAMRDAKERNPDWVLCVIDLTGAAIVADQKSLSQLVNLMKFNKDYVTRTGVYGANVFTRHIVDIALKITRRTNMKMCATEAEAEDWVYRNKKPPKLSE
jgi:hypothetical protein